MSFNVNSFLLQLFAHLVDGFLLLLLPRLTYNLSNYAPPSLFSLCHIDVDGANAQGYDTGIGGSTSTIVSPLGSPQPQLRSHAQRNAALARYMQVSAY